MARMNTDQVRVDPEGVPAASEVLHSVSRDLVGELRREIGQRWGVPSRTMAVTRASGEVLSTGCALVDELLPGEGIPRGRLTEVSGPLSSGKTSLVAALVGQVLRGRERVAWVDPGRVFHAPSVARAGTPLQNLLLVQPFIAQKSRRVFKVRGAPEMCGAFEVFRAGEHLVRSRAFGLVVMDAVGLPGRGVAAPLFRLSRLALRCDTAVVLVTDHPEHVSSLGSCVALRLCVERRSYCFDPEPRPPFDLSGYRIEVQVGKTRLGPAGDPRLVEVRSAEGVFAR